MENALISIGLLNWFLISVIGYVFLSPINANSQKKILRFFRIRLNHTTKQELRINYMKCVCLFWFCIGVFIKILNHLNLSGNLTDLNFTMIILFPVLLGAYLSKKLE